MQTTESRVDEMPLAVGDCHTRPPHTDLEQHSTGFPTGHGGGCCYCHPCTAQRTDVGPANSRLSAEDRAGEATLSIDNCPGEVWDGDWVDGARILEQEPSCFDLEVLGNYATYDHGICSYLADPRNHPGDDLGNGQDGQDARDAWAADRHAYSERSESPPGEGRSSSRASTVSRTASQRNFGLGKTLGLEAEQWSGHGPYAPGLRRQPRRLLADRVALWGSVVAAAAVPTADEYGYDNTEAY